MRKPILIICIIILLFCLWLLLHRTEPVISNSTEAQMPLTNKQAASQQSTLPKKIIEPQTTNVSSPAKKSHRPTLIEVNQQLLTDWQRPIEFYGKVVDENTNPVANANITFYWMETPFGENGSRSLCVKSDAEGLFSLTGAAGPTLSVSIGKNGYYTSHSTSDSFRYDGGNPFQARQLEPVVFHLRKKSQGVELVTSENGMQLKVDARIPKDSTPVKIDFFQKRPSSSGQLEISQIKPPFQTATNWSFSLSIPDGGLVENQDEFQFAAPESGYQPTVEYNFTKGGTNWTTQVSKQFYIVFGQPRKYGWLRIESNLSQETIFLTYAINPDGTQNLEPK